MSRRPAAPLPGAIVFDPPAPRRPAITLVGSSAEMTPAVAAVVAELIALGRANRERR